VLPARRLQVAEPRRRADHREEGAGEQRRREPRTSP
jgi:hypothetical protein